MIEYPEALSEEHFLSTYSVMYKKFFTSIQQSDILFVVNATKKGITGYIGAQVFAEIAFAVISNLLDSKKRSIIFLCMPSPQVQSYDEICLWQKLGLVEIFHE